MGPIRAAHGTHGNHRFKQFWGLRFRGLRFRGLSFRGLRFRGLRFRGLRSSFLGSLFSKHPTEHFLLLCPTFDAQRRDLFAGIVELIRPFRQITDLSNDSLTQLLLYGDQDLSTELNRNILELTLRFIHDTCRFD